LFELNKDKVINNFSLRPLKYNSVLETWLEEVLHSTVDGLKCTHYQNLKRQEVLYYLRAYYSKEDLYAFFSPILNNDTIFANLIYQNYESIKNIGELADITHYSMSGFKRKFTTVFGISPAVWIKREKAKKIYHEINCSQKPFKIIANEYDFSSPAQFNEFCKKMYKMSPGTLRKNTKERVLSSNLSKGSGLTLNIDK
jgi:AraC-like DNA-binding protein